MLVLGEPEKGFHLTQKIPVADLSAQAVFQEMFKMRGDDLQENAHMLFILSSSLGQVQQVVALALEEE
jgi:hypothetical protein